MWTWFYRLASPPHFYRVAASLVPWLLWPALLLIVLGTWGGLVIAPADYQQGDGYRIIYVHVPSSYLSMMIYVTMALAAGIGLIWRIKLSEILFLACAPIGAMFTAITLITGMLWGKPTWGAYWVWDARLTSELVLLFLYFGVIGLASAYDDLRQGARAAAVLAIVGVVNVPIIHFSVKWWNTLHQGETIRIFGKSSMDSSMIWPLLIMALATKLYFVFALLLRARGVLLEQERNKAWVREVLLGVKN